MPQKGREFGGSDREVQIPSISPSTLYKLSNFSQPQFYYLNNEVNNNG